MGENQIRTQGALHMIDAKQLPDEVVEAAARAIFEHWQFQCPVEIHWTPNGNSLMQEKARDFARDGLAAALNAWPNADTTCKFIQHKKTGERIVPVDCLRLPLPQEGE